MRRGSMAVRLEGWVVVAGAFVFTACGGEQGPTQPPGPVVATVQVTPAADTLPAIGATRQLAAVAKDASGNPISGKTFTWQSSAPGVATVSGTGLVTAVANGSATITATTDAVSGSAALTVAQEVATVTVTPGTAALTAIGATQQFTAVAKDANNNTLAGVKFLWVSSNQSVATVDTTGLATARGPGQAIVTAAGRGVPGNATLGVNQTATQLAFSVQPSNTVAGEAISPAVQVEIRDAGGVLVAGARDAVTLAIGTNPGSGTLSGTKIVNAVGGIATFSGLSIDKAGNGYTLAASSGSLTGAASTGFTVSPGTIAQLLFTTQPPANVEGNVTISPAVQVTLRDAFGNTVPTGSVTMAIGTAPWPQPGSRLSGTLTADAVNGVATFVDLRVDKPGRGYTLVASSGGASGASIPFRVRLTFNSLDAGGPVSEGWHNCGVTSGGTYCWGYNFNGELGAATTSSAYGDSVPVLVGGGLTFVEVAAGGEHSCGRTSGGTVHCWGRGTEGQLGNGGNANSATPVQVTGSGVGALVFTAISAGAQYTCGVTSGSAVYCWGRNGDGQLGNGGTTNTNGPALVTGSGAGLLLFTSVSAGERHTCGVTTANAAYCWGLNASGQLGDGTTMPRTTPVAVNAALSWAAISAGQFYTCGVTTGNVAYCWGDNVFGQLGDGTTTTRISPTAVSGTLSFTQISASYDHTCGRVGFGAYCWGRNASGQLGTSTTTNSLAPVPVVRNVGEFGFYAVSAGNAHTCGFDQFGPVGARVICWGANFVGQLGDGTHVQRLEPVVVVQ